MRAARIIKMAKDIVKLWKTNDPYEIAEKLGIEVVERKININGFKAHTIKTEGYPTIIAINNNYADISKKVLCAHELGHAILHSEGINHFDVTSKNAMTNVEYEANLFALALLVDEDKLNMPMGKMSNYTIKTILDYNIYEE